MAEAQIAAGHYEPDGYGDARKFLVNLYTEPNGGDPARPLRLVGSGTWLHGGGPFADATPLSMRAHAGVVEYTPGDLVITVRDEGPGLSADILPRLFEKFYRGAQQTPKDERGSGLGLAIRDRLTRAAGGRVVSLESPID